jgi:hypothetical protein
MHGASFCTAPPLAASRPARAWTGTRSPGQGDEAGRPESRSLDASRRPGAPPEEILVALPGLRVGLHAELPRGKRRGARQAALELPRSGL